MLSKKSSNKVHSLIMEQIKDVENCLVSFESFMRAATTPATANEALKSLSQGVFKAEDVADCSLRRMIDSLADSAFLPSTVEDIISVATRCDKVANKCEAISNTIVLQKFCFPDGYADGILKVLETTHTQFDLLEESINMFFSKLGALQQDHSILDKIRAYESEVDSIEFKLTAKCFEENDLARAMQIGNIIELCCDISDIIEDIADKIQIMLIARKV